MSTYHHGNLRSALLEEGLALLAEKGADGFSLRELARRVGVTANASYRHFANKEALMTALAAEGFRRLRITQEAAEAAADGADRRLLAGGLCYLRFADANPALFRLMFGADRRRADGDPELTAAATAAFETLRQAVARTGGADPDTVTRTALRAWALVHGLSHLLLDGQLDHFPSDRGDGALAVAEAALKDAIRNGGPV